QQLVGYVVLAAGGGAAAAAVRTAVGATPTVLMGRGGVGVFGCFSVAGEGEGDRRAVSSRPVFGGVGPVARRTREGSMRAVCARRLPRYWVWSVLGSTTTFSRSGATASYRSSW